MFMTLMISIYKNKLVFVYNMFTLMILFIKKKNICIHHIQDIRVYNIIAYYTIDKNIITTTKIRIYYGVIQSFISHIAIAILDFSLLLLVKLSLLIPFASFLVSVLCFFFDGSLSLQLSLFQLSR